MIGTAGAKWERYGEKRTIDNQISTSLHRLENDIQIRPIRSKMEYMSLHPEKL